MAVTKPDLDDLVAWLQLRSPVAAAQCSQLGEALDTAIDDIESRITLPACVGTEAESDTNYPPRVRYAILLTASRLAKRTSSPEGVAGFGEMGVVRITQTDPDVEKLIARYLRLDGFGVMTTGFDLASIREDLARVMQCVGFNTFSYVMTEPETYPAAFAGLPSALAPLTARQWKVTLPLTMLFSTADQADAQRRLDCALSPGATGSVYDALHEPGFDPAWKSLRWVRADNAREVLIGNTRAFAFDITLELTA